MPVDKYNSLKVRRVDLLEQLEERFAWMDKKKQEYEVLDTKHHEACDKYREDEEAWEKKIQPFMLAKFKKVKPEFGRVYGRRYWHEGTWRVDATLQYTIDELKELIPGFPENPVPPTRPDFLMESGYGSRTKPSIYNAVYQAIRLLHLSDDEYVSASTYQIALEAL